MTEISDFSALGFLIADDRAFIRELIQSTLRRYGAKNVLQASSGREAIDVLDRSGPQIDCAICDWNMEPLTGLEVLQIVRAGGASETRRDLPFILLTGHADSPLVKSALDLDVSGFLVKPVAQKKLVDAIDKAIASSPEIKAASHYKKTHMIEVPKDLKDPERLNPVWVAWSKISHEQEVLTSKLNNIQQEAKAVSEEHTKIQEFRNKTRVPLEYVTAGSLLAEDIIAEDGTKLLGAGTLLSQRLLERLSELAAESDHRAYIYIGEPA